MWLPFRRCPRSGAVTMSVAGMQEGIPEDLFSNCWKQVDSDLFSRATSCFSWHRFCFFTGGVLRRPLRRGRRTRLNSARAGLSPRSSGSACLWRSCFCRKVFRFRGAVRCSWRQCHLVPENARVPFMPRSPSHSVPDPSGEDAQNAQMLPASVFERETVHNTSLTWIVIESE